MEAKLIWTSNKSRNKTYPCGFIISTPWGNFRAYWTQKWVEDAK